ncbi:MAG TPA: hypothetical protein VKJ07_11680, partial [Mycobacteriales bacterium]|nr:hypothetical protein [Mycobacteriales bacterium]
MPSPPATITGRRHANVVWESGWSGTDGEGVGEGAVVADGVAAALEREGLGDVMAAVVEDEHALSATSATIARRIFTAVSTSRRRRSY